MEGGISLTFGSFIAECVLFVAALLVLFIPRAKGSTFQARRKLCSFLLLAMTLCALTALFYPILLISSTMTSKTSFAWPYLVVFGSAPVMPIVIWMRLRAAKR